MPPTPSALSDLAAAASGGDRRAFEALHDRFQAGLRRLFLARCGGRQDLADDLVQRTWMECWKSVCARRYDPARSAFSTFLYAVGTNVWREHLRARGRARPGPTEADSASTLEPRGEAELAELLDDVRRGLSGSAGGIDEDDRAVLRAISEGESDRAMAQRFGVAPSTMNARKRAALERLRTWLAARGYRGERAGGETQ